MSADVRVVYEPDPSSLLKGAVQLSEGYHGTPYVAFRWPTDAPEPFNDPGCVLREWTWCGVVVQVVSTPSIQDCFGGKWWVLVQMPLGDRQEVVLSDLRPVEKCFNCFGGSHGPCPVCGRVASDRREKERRKGERREVGNRHGGGRRSPSLYDRRSGKDRRRKP